MDKYYKPGEQISGYSIIKLIGEGRYGIAYLAEDHQSHKYVIKQLKRKMLDETREKSSYEEKILRQLSAPCFPKFIDRFSLPLAEGYIMEYMEGRIFEDLLVEDGYRFTKKEIYEVGFKLLDLIAILQQNHIVHRDIRLPNVIIGENNQLILIDFGLARYIQGSRYTKDMDYWYLGDFLIHLYYTSYYLEQSFVEKPWYEELDLTSKESYFLKRLMGIEKVYTDLEEIKRDLKAIQEDIS